MAAKLFKQGDDCKIPLVISETPAIDFSLAEDIRVVLSIGAEEQKKYSLNEQTDYGIVEVDTEDTNTLNVYVERDHSVDFKVGTIRAYIIAKFPNAEFPDGGEIKSWELICARVLAGKALGEDI